MSNVGNMLSVVMDGITDTNMMLDYFEEAEEGSDCAVWFYNHAKRRLQMLEDDYSNVVDLIGLKQRVSDGDEVARALHDHIMYQVGCIRKRM